MIHASIIIIIIILKKDKQFGAKSTREDDISEHNKNVGAWIVHRLYGNRARETLVNIFFTYKKELKM